MEFNSGFKGLMAKRITGVIT